MNEPSTLSLSACKRIGECLKADYHKIGYGFDYRFKIAEHVGLLVTKWASGTERTNGFPDRWEVYKLSISPEHPILSSVAEKLGESLTEEEVIRLADNVRRRLNA